MSSALVIPFAPPAALQERQERERREQAFIEACEAELDSNPVDLADLIARAERRLQRQERQR